MSLVKVVNQQFLLNPMIALSALGKSPVVVYVLPGLKLLVKAADLAN